MVRVRARVNARVKVGAAVRLGLELGFVQLNGF